ncbi:hypothetical protein [Polaribacter sargassicola]|uniref:hypothetical protein n=1 Tax=Polaribacter sargassicola TaxID=2836891 RepID=UPI001F20D311|nr:hypothetical protein [Polaribacter sp. DS7-9]MCG1037224.1 hypothetical protein [Polaribacter sp. DS7-9]
MKTIKILSILSISLQFLSFWLAAPEILGGEWLKKTESFIRSGIMVIPSIILGIIGMIIGFLLDEGVGSLNLKLLIPIILFFILIIIFYKKIKVWLDQKISKPILNKLIINDSFRFTLLRFAAILFTLGFFLQIITIIYQ